LKIFFDHDPLLLSWHPQELKVIEMVQMFFTITKLGQICCQKIKKGKMN
jgi:hypothetical protein